VMKKVLLIFGSRPDCIRLAPIFFGLKKSLIFNPLVCVDKQRDESLERALNDFGITPDLDLGTMQTDQSLESITISTLDQERSIIASHLDSDILFAPTAFVKERLLIEYAGIPIHIVGSTAIDSLQWTFDNGGLSKQSAPKPILIAVQEGKGLQNICAATLELTRENRVIFILPQDIDPRFAVLEHLFGTDVELVELPPYSKYINLVRQSYLILTDSEGLQEIGPALDIPVLVLGDKTEYSEGVIAGAARLVGTDQRSILHNVKCLLNNQEKYSIMSKAKNPYGDGRAARRIVKIMEEEYKNA